MCLTRCWEQDVGVKGQISQETGGSSVCVHILQLILFQQQCAEIGRRHAWQWNADWRRVKKQMWMKIQLEESTSLHWFSFIHLWFRLLCGVATTGCWFNRFRLKVWYRERSADCCIMEEDLWSDNLGVGTVEEGLEVFTFSCHVQWRQAGLKRFLVDPQSSLWFVRISWRKSNPFSLRRFYYIWLNSTPIRASLTWKWIIFHCAWTDHSAYLKPQQAKENATSDETS